MTDEELVELIRTQDQERFSELVSRYQERLLRYAKYLMRDEDKAKDAVQEAFIKAFTNLHGFNVQKKFSSWIYRIVHNEAISSVKKRKWELSLDMHTWIHETVAGEQDVQGDAEDEEIASLVREVVGELPLQYREPLILYYFDGLSYEDISDVMRIPINTVGTRISRGKKRVRELYHRKGGEAYVRT